MDATILDASRDGAREDAASDAAQSDAESGQSDTSSEDASSDGAAIGDAATDGDACASVALATHVAPGNVVVVFDQSDSMNQAFALPDGGAAGPKWQVARDAVVQGITSNERALNVGAIFFPTVATGNTCSLVDSIGTPPQIPLEPGASFLADFQAHFAASGWTLILGTPVVAALTRVAAALPIPFSSPGPRTVLFVTDGAPTCDTATADVLAPVQAMFAGGIQTYAIGLPGSAAAATLLDAIAAAGGTTSSFAPADPPALQAKFAQIAAESSDPCILLVDSAPTDASQVHLIATDTTHPGGYEIAQGDAGDAWSLSDDRTALTLLGAVCTTERAGGYTTLQLVDGCPVLP